MRYTQRKKQNNKNKKDKRVKFSENIEDINSEFIKRCEKEFNKDPVNIISRNAIVAIGSTLATTNSNRVNEIDHTFMNSIKKKNLKATNQGRSGRCWIFASLNMFRHTLINALELENFEFSETYLFFWDKFERANTFLRWFINNPNVSRDDESFKFIIEDFTGDGGWWNMCANLIRKYGLIPKSAMKETFQSDDSEDMNQILNEQLQSAANYIFTNSDLSIQELDVIRTDTLQQIYTTLVKFLGEPPKKFRWSYTNDDDVSNIIADLTPTQFTKMCIPNVNLDEFVVLTNLPGILKYNTLYEVNCTTNVYEGNNFNFLNVTTNELAKYACKSILSGMPVWFAADICQDFNPYHSTLDDKLSDESKVFDKKFSFNKEERISFRNLQANHAMTIVGVNTKSNGKPESWQVENSWGYWDHETPGEDGFLFMSQSWFEKNVMQVVIHKNYLSRTVQKLLSQPPVKIEPWNCVAPALKIVPKNTYQTYILSQKFKKIDYK
jgi:bleomycin hydrolase